MGDIPTGIGVHGLILGRRKGLPSIVGVQILRTEFTRSRGLSLEIGDAANHLILKIQGAEVKASTIVLQFSRDRLNRQLQLRNLTACKRD